MLIEPTAEDAEGRVRVTKPRVQDVKGVNDSFIVVAVVIVILDSRDKVKPNYTMQWASCSYTHLAFL